MANVLITGGHGFLGRNTALYFSQRGHSIYGIGHGHWGLTRSEDYGYLKWYESDVNKAGLSLIDAEIDIVVHCAGGSSVGSSFVHPFGEFQRTVDSTAHVLEFLRAFHPGARLIYPSSAAVYGDQPDVPLTEDCPVEPVSPYGFYKKIVEELCLSYAKNFNIKTVVIRFFSIYGAGLEKQLLWDACRKLTEGQHSVIFYGNGRETRDWIHVHDAASLIGCLAENDCEGNFQIFNGGSGQRQTVLDILLALVDELQVKTKVEMCGRVKEGDPRHYWADTSKVEKIGWKARYSFSDGLKEYIEWFGKRKLLELRL